MHKHIRTIGLVLSCLLLQAFLVTPGLAANGTDSDFFSTSADTLKALSTLPKAAPSDTIAITILHTNDIHGHLLGSMDDDNPLPALYETICQQRVGDERDDEDTVLVDAGDLFEGSAIDFLTKGKMMVDALGLFGYDTWTLGNHDFCIGRQTLAKRVAEARQAGVSVLGANVIDDITGRCADELANPYKIIERDGVKIAIIGVAHGRTKEMNYGKRTAGISFLAPEEAISYYAKRLDGADIVIVVGHLGLKPAKRTFAKLPGAVKVFIDGHSHKAQRKAQRVPLADGSTMLLVQAGHSLDAIGRLTLYFDKETKKPVLDGTAVAHNYTLAPLTKSATPLIASQLTVPTKEEIRQGRALAEEVLAYFDQKFVSPHAGKLNRSAGRTAVALKRPETGRPDPFGNMLCDALRKKADELFTIGELTSVVPSGVTKEEFLNQLVAIASPKSIRGFLPSGADIQYDTLHKHLPFDNKVCVLALSGHELGQLITGARWHKRRGGVLCAGLSGTVRSRGSREGRLDRLTINGRPLLAGETYYLATSDFIASGQAGWKHVYLKDNKTVTTTILARDALFDYLIERKTMDDIGLAENECRIHVE
mgnify:FL=1